MAESKGRRRLAQSSLEWSPCRAESTVTKVAPVRLVGLMMGAWFFATSLGNKLAGYLSGFFVANDAGVLVWLYGGIAVGLLVSAVVLALLTPTIKKLMEARG